MSPSDSHHRRTGLAAIGIRDRLVCSCRAGCSQAQTGGLWTESTLVRPGMDGPCVAGRRGDGALATGMRRRTFAATRRCERLPNEPGRPMSTRCCRSSGSLGSVGRGSSQRVVDWRRATGTDGVIPTASASSFLVGDRPPVERGKPGARVRDRALPAPLTIRMTHCEPARRVSLLDLRPRVLVERLAVVRGIPVD
jgi:hypothetical protein